MDKELKGKIKEHLKLLEDEIQQLEDEEMKFTTTLLKECINTMMIRT